MEENVSKKTNPAAIIIAAIVIALIAAGVMLIRKSDRMSDEYFKEIPVSPNDTLDIEGFYTIRTITDSTTTFATGELRKAPNREDGYQMTVLSDFKPHSSYCKITSPGVIRSEIWGDGTIKFRPEYSTITISYKLNDHTICELTK